MELILTELLQNGLLYNSFPQNGQSSLDYLSHWCQDKCALMQMLPMDCHWELPSLTTLSNGQWKGVAEMLTVVKLIIAVVDVHVYLDNFMEVTGHKKVHME